MPPPPQPAPALPAAAPFKQAEKLHIADLAQLKAISDPQRLEILEAVIHEARTVKQIADLLGKPATKLYYHMNALEAAGFVAVVETRVKSGIIEKYYRTTAQNVEVDRKLLKASAGKKSDALESILSTIMDTTSDEIRRSVAIGLMDLSAKEKPKRKRVIISRSLFSLSEADVSRFVAKFQALLKEIEAKESPSGAANYACTVAFYPRVTSGKKAGRKTKRSAK